MHFGKITFDVDERGEVGMLTRNIKLQASADAEQSFYGGHVMAMATSKMFVEGVEFNRMGQNLTLARYPIHWHLIGDAQGQYIKNASIHDTYNRCVTVHGTNFLRVENNVTYNTVGHCFFLEDGAEHGNEFVHNLAIQTKCHTSKACVPTRLAAAGESETLTIARPSERMARPPRMSCFPRTTRWRLTGSPIRTTLSATTWPRVPTRTASGCHCRSTRRVNSKARRSVRRPGRVERHSASSRATSPTPTTTRSCSTGTLRPITLSVLPATRISPKENPADANSKTVETVFEDLTAYKNRNGGIWGRGEMHVFRNVKLADNAMGYTHASGSAGRDPFTSKVVDSLFVGETENIGNPRTDAEKAYGRSLPKPAMPDFPIRGYEYYDYRHDVENVTFRNFEDNATRKTGALSYLMYTSAGVSTENAIERAKFVNAKPVYFPPMERKWGNDNLNGVAWKAAAIHDKDGSVGGVPNSYILINDGVNDSIATDAQACEIKPTWNAAVCKGDVGRLTFGGGGGGGAQVLLAPWRRLLARRQPGGRGAAAGPGAPELVVPVAGAGREVRSCTCSAASRSQPQWQGVHPNLEQRTSRYRDQGDHRKAERVPHPDGNGCRLVGDLRAAGIHHRSLGYAASQPGCAAQGQRHLVLQGQGCTVGQGGLQRRRCSWPHWRRPWWWNQPPGQPVS